MKNKAFRGMLAGMMILFAACGQTDNTSSVELHIFAAASMTETMDQVIEHYQAEVPGVTVIPTYDSSGTLLTQIQEGAECDLFLPAAEKQMDALETEGALLAGSRLDLLENKVVLAVPDGNPKGIKSLGQLAALLQTGEVMLAVGSSDVPAGQYAQKIFAWYGINEAGIAANLTYGSNVKEVTTQLREAAADCGIIYATDAYSAALETVDSASAEMCGQVVYPAAVLASTEYPAEAQAFLDYLTGEAAGETFASAGFIPLTR